MRGHVGVLGAGLQGACVALAFAKDGHRVTLFDRRVRPLDAASRWNEGKIHLGYTFAMDKTLATARVQIAGAVRFLAELERIAGIRRSDIDVSERFVYAVPRTSLLTPDEITSQFQKIDALVQQAARPETSYLGERLGAPIRRLSEVELERRYDTSEVLAAFQTQERSVHPGRLCDRLLEAIASEPRIELRCGVQIERLNPKDDRVVVLDSEGLAHGPFAKVVNCLWEDRLRVDATLPVAPPDDWTVRYKAAVHATSLPNTPSPIEPTTFILGEYGDIVPFPGDQFYFSWYPACLIGQTSRMLEPPWLEPDGDDDEELVGAVHGSLQRLVPQIGDLDLASAKILVRGGHIFTQGSTAILDPKSPVHMRNSVGPKRHQNVISIDTGKLGLAPMFARAALELDD